MKNSSKILNRSESKIIKDCIFPSEPHNIYTTKLEFPLEVFQLMRFHGDESIENLKH